MRPGACASGMDVNRRNFVSAGALASPLIALLGGRAALGQGWLSFRAQFEGPDGRIVDTGNGGVSHSEGQGYGMILAEAADDRQGFADLWAWTQAHLQRREDCLFSWRYDPRASPPVQDANNATDGDILLAWALLRAGRRWAEARYIKASHDIRSAIATLLLKPMAGGTILLPGLTGFSQPEFTVVNPSYYVWPALDDFHAADPGGPWDRVIDDGLGLLEKAQFGGYGLPTDWVKLDGEGVVAPARDRPPRFGYDAIRIPLYLSWSGRVSVLTPYIRYWRGLISAGRPIPAWRDVVTGAAADYALDSGGMAVVDLTLGESPSHGAPSATDYYAAALYALATLAALESART